MRNGRLKKRREIATRLPRIETSHKPDPFPQKSVDKASRYAQFIPILAEVGLACETIDRDEEVVC